MSLSKQAVADLAREIKDCRVMAFANADGDRSRMYPCFVGGLEATIGHFIEKQLKDSTEVRAAFDYEPTPEEVRAYQDRQAKWRADYAARMAAATTASGSAA